MGSDEAGGDEAPARTVWVDAFFIDRLETTQEEYARCVEVGACSEPHHVDMTGNPDTYGDVAFSSRPVVGLSWYQANDYCTWAGKRLPTEAEWERAARGEDGRPYPWGDADPSCDLAQYSGCGYEPLEVGTLPAGASPFGVLDMAGNVSEWVADWYSWDAYETQPAENPQGPAAGSYKVLRGGSWTCGPEAMTTFARAHARPDVPLGATGVRCARSP